MNGSPLPTLVSYSAYDRLLGLDQVAWSQRFKDDEKKNQEAEDEAKKKGFTMRREGTKPSHELEAFTGDYQHPGYGVMHLIRPAKAASCASPSTAFPGRSNISTMMFSKSPKILSTLCKKRR